MIYRAMAAVMHLPDSSHLTAEVFRRLTTLDGARQTLISVCAVRVFVGKTIGHVFDDARLG